MSASLLIKICGLKDPESALKVAQAGADFIGLIFHPASKRYLSLAQAASVCTAIKTSRAIPVAVFVEQDAAAMITICQQLSIEYVQLHGTQARQAHSNLAPSIKRIYALTVDPAGNVISDNAKAFEALDPGRDYLIFDGPMAGSGERIASAKLTQASRNFRFFLAGGLNPANVVAAIASCQPDAVDVATGVENALGDKDLVLVKQFIANARGVSHYV